MKNLTLKIGQSDECASLPFFQESLENRKRGEVAGDISTVNEITSPRLLSVLGYVLFDLRVFLRDFIIKMPVI